MTPCRLVNRYRRFGGAFYSVLYGGLSLKQCNKTSTGLKLESVNSSEMSLPICQSTRQGTQKKSKATACCDCIKQPSSRRMYQKQSKDVRSCFGLAIKKLCIDALHPYYCVKNVRFGGFTRNTGVFLDGVAPDGRIQLRSDNDVDERWP